MENHIQAENRPEWLTKSFIHNQSAEDLKKSLSSYGINTVCVEARCPNQNECFSNGFFTFLILGDTCTRKCAFCSTKKGTPPALDAFEAYRILSMIDKLSLKYVLITSVSRDDLLDGGLYQYISLIDMIKARNPETVIEILTPDFNATTDAALRLAACGTDVFSHNMETVSSLYDRVRPGADYKTSLSLLKEVKALSSGKIVTKSGFMLGLGESESGVRVLLEDLMAAKIDILTIGQYMRPYESCHPVIDFVKPETFDNYRSIALDMGIPVVKSGPFIRSSFMAEQAYREALSANRDAILVGGTHGN